MSQELTLSPIGFRLQTRIDTALSDFLSGVSETTIDKLDFGCNKPFGPLFNTMEEAWGMVHNAKKLTDEVFGMMECERISHIYAKLVYEGTCTHSVEGFTWAFSCLLVVSIMAMTMIMLRSSYQNTQLLVNEAECGKTDIVKASAGFNEDELVTMETGSSVNDSGLVMVKDEETGSVEVDEKDEKAVTKNGSVGVVEGGDIGVDCGDTDAVVKNEAESMASTKFAEAEQSNMRYDEYARHETPAATRAMDQSC